MAGPSDTGRILSADEGTSTPPEEGAAPPVLPKVNGHHGPEEAQVDDPEKPVSVEDAVRSLRRTRGEALTNLKKTRMAFRSAAQAADSGALRKRTESFNRKDLNGQG